MVDIKPDNKYHVVSALDIEELLPFVKKETRSLTEEISEDKRVKKELLKFIEVLRKHTKEKIYYIGEERKLGKHQERFMFGKGGFFEIVIEAPVSINAHFLEKKRANNFGKGLKKTAYRILPDSKVKGLFINSIKIGKPDNDEFTFDKWHMMHKLGIHKTFVYTLIAVAVVLMFEGVQTVVEYLSLEVFQVKVHSIYVSVAAALFVALFFEPIKVKASRLVERLLEDKK